MDYGSRSIHLTRPHLQSLEVAKGVLGGKLGRMPEERSPKVHGKTRK